MEPSQLPFASFPFHKSTMTMASKVRVLVHRIMILPVLCVSFLIMVKAEFIAAHFSGTLVGNIFYSEGLVALTAPNLSDFGKASPDNFKWRTDFKGSHTIPVNIYRCRAPAGELNASTNTTFYTIPTSGPDRNFRMILTSSVYPYITAVGLSIKIMNW